jgi:hypothetical protein
MTIRFLGRLVPVAAMVGTLVGVPAAAASAQAPVPDAAWAGTFSYTRQQMYGNNTPNPGGGQITRTYLSSHAATTKFTGRVRNGRFTGQGVTSGRYREEHSQDQVSPCPPEFPMPQASYRFSSVGAGAVPSVPARYLYISFTSRTDGRIDYSIDVSLWVDVPVAVRSDDRSTACDGKRYDNPTQYSTSVTLPGLTPKYRGILGPADGVITHHQSTDLGNGTTVIWSLAMTRSCGPSARVAAPVCVGSTAEAGGPYTVNRGSVVTLDGSRSKGTITRYAWSFKPGAACPPKTTLRASKKAGKKVTVVALCDLTATLTTTDKNKRTATDTALITVKDRPFPVSPISYKAQPWGATVLDSRTPRGEPTAPSRPGGVPDAFVGLNVSTCSNEKISVFCPYLLWPFESPRSYLNTGYTLKRVSDAGGPFHDFFYVNTAKISFSRIGLLNPWVLPNGPKGTGATENFYNHNKAKKLPVDLFLTRIGDHEGEGLPGVPKSGHVRALRDAIAVNPKLLNPNPSIEKLFGPTQAAAQRATDDQLTKLAFVLKAFMGDPLPAIFGPQTLEFWDPAAQAWVPGTVVV